MTGSVVAGPSVVNLTMEGTSDWMHWGLVDATSVNRKAGVTAQIKGFVPLVTIKGRFTGGSPSSTLSWTDGTPTATQAGFAGGIYFRDLNNGYTFTVPADTTLRTLKVYLGGYITTSKVVATLSDGSAAPYVATFGDLSTVYARIVTIKYRAAASGQKLTFKHTLAGGTNNINVQAVTLQADVPPAALTKRVGGSWLSPESDNWPLIPIHAALLPDGRVLTYGSDDAGTQTGYFIYDVWDPAAGLAGGHVTLQNMTLTDIFCSAQVVLPQSGSVLIAGGDNWTGTSTTNTGNSNSLVYSNENLTRANDMNRARWYASATVLTNGEIYIQGGSGGADRPEVRQLDGTFRLLSAADTSSLRSFYPRNFVAADGRIFGIDNFGRMYYVTPGGTGAIAMAGQLASANAGSTSSAAMFRAGRILQIGGNSNGAIVIDITGGSPVVTPTQSMSSRRQWVTATLLPDGRVLATGGSAVENELVDVSNAAEIWDPATGHWTLGASGARARLYHSEALLLADATVLVGGGGAPGPLNNRHVEIYFPPYFYDAADNLKPRPSIASAPSSLRIGQQFSLDVGAANIARVTLLKTGSVTHSFNMDQRFLELPFTNANGTLEVQAPSNPAEAPPGYYLLFVIDDNGAPSVGRIVRVNIAGVDESAPTVPGGLTVTATTDSSVSLAWSASSDSGGSGLAGYRIYRGISTTPLATTTETTYMDAGLSPATYYSYRVTAYDVVGNESAAVGPVTARTAVAGSGENIAPSAAATASSESAAGQTAEKAIDGVVDGYPGDATREWVTNGERAGAWIRLTWDSPRTVDRVVLFDRPNLDDQITGATISFSDGSSVAIGPLGNAGTGAEVLVAPRSVASVTVSVASVSVSTTNAGLAEVEVYGGSAPLPADANHPPALTGPGNQTGTVGLALSRQVVASDADNDTLTYSAIGLPAGLEIDANTGLITGTPTVSGTGVVVIAVSDGATSSSAALTWAIDAETTLVLDPMPKQAPLLVNTSTTYAATSHDGVNTQYKWYFGDGSESAWSSSPTVTHTFTRPTLFWVTVTARDDRGFMSSQTFAQLVHLPLTPQRPTVSGNLALGDGRLWVVNQDNDSISAFDVASNQKLGEVNVGTAPRAVAVSPSGEVWVTNRQSASISVINPATLSVSRTIGLPAASQPFGIAFVPDGSAAFVALEAIGQVLKLDPVSGNTLGTATVGGAPRHVSVSADSNRVYVSCFITARLPGEATAAVATTVNGVDRGAEVWVLNAGDSGRVTTIVLKHSDDADFENQGSGIPNYLGAAVISPDGASAWVPSKKDNVKRGSLRSGTNLNHQNTVRAISSRIDLGSDSEVFAARIDHDNASLASAGAFDPYGVFLFVALETSREVAVVDAHNHAEFFRIGVGRAPQGIAVSPDGHRLYVNNFMDRTVGVYDITKVEDEGQWQAPLLATLRAVGTEKLNATVLQGKQFFYDARDTRLARESYLSCASCHNDGGHDGRVWDFTGLGEGLRNTIALAGRAGAQGFQHWSGNFDEVQDFEGQIRSLAGGTGLMTDAAFNQGTRSQPLGDKKAGVSTDLDALATYVGSLNVFARSPFRNADGSLTSDGAAGKTVFEQLQCAQCHSGANFTDSGAVTLRDIGTIKQPTSGHRLGLALTGIDTPTLRDVWATAPYLHDGSAATLNEAVRAHNGVTLEDADLAKLVTYLKQIDGQEPAPTAIGAALIGSVVAGPSVVNLTMEGTSDWMHWGLVDATSVNRKAGVTAQIKGFVPLVTIKGRFTGGSPSSTLSWTDGTPTATQAGFAGGIYFRDLNNGYTFTVPADTTLRTLKVYLGGYITTSKVVATLSDGSAAPYVATFGDLSTVYARIVIIKYRAAASGQKLTFKHTLAGGTNNINVQAVTLSKGP